MDRTGFLNACRERAPTPAYVVSTRALQRNLDILGGVKSRTGCRILLALKAFSMFRVFPLLRERLDGVCASGVYEARLGRERFGGETHAYGAAFSERDVRELVGLCDHIDFNSFAQWRRFRPLVEGRVRCGLRINPECSTGRTPMYDPCAPFSRLGMTRAQFEGETLDGIAGLHVHTLCEQNADALETTLQAVEEKFAPWLDGLEWVNFGGGHHITRADYDIELLVRLINAFKARHGTQVYLEPGEAVALRAGALVATVLDTIHNGMPIAILDTSATTHMPDVLEMPYRPEIVDAGPPGERAHTCRLAGPSCLAGDVIGDYSFDEPLQPGDRLIFEDMAHYTMVKNTTFNGIPLPTIALYDDDLDRLDIVRAFGYEDFETRLS